MTDDLVERVIDAMSNCGSETVGSRMARAAIAVCMEEAAKVCISVSIDALTKVGREHEPYMRATAEDCAAAIRALVKEPT